MIKPEDQSLVIFGASGDLTHRKLLPALFKLFRQQLLPENFSVIGTGRTAFTDETFRDMTGRSLGTGKKREENSAFLSMLHYVCLGEGKKEDYRRLERRLSELEQNAGRSANRIYYLAIPPDRYIPVSCLLAGEKMNLEGENHGWKRLIVEKPFGVDLESAIRLNRNLRRHFQESQLYRIDHYLGKETVQNILVTRFSNGIFEPLWNRNYIHHIEITSSEHLGVENRGGYYDSSGALRDMLQNHLLQLVCLAAMEPPTVIEAGAIRNEMLKVLQSLRPFSKEDVLSRVIRGQYLGSRVKGQNLQGYREEKGVDRQSRTETYIAMKFFIDNWRWGGVPFYVRTGKRLPLRVTEIVVHFRPTPHKLFLEEFGVCQTCNQLIIRIQPDEGILLKFAMKVPGAGYRVQEMAMDFHYADLPHETLPDAYERLLLDAMNGDATLFSRGDVVEAAWEFVNPVLKAWKNHPDIPLYGYPAGTWGPEVADRLIEGPGMTWRYPCKNLAENGAYCEL